MLSTAAAILARLVAVARGADTRRLDVRRVMTRRRHRDAFDDLAHDSRLEHQNRADGDGPSVVQALLLRRRAPRDRYVTDPGKFHLIFGRDAR